MSLGDLKAQEYTRSYTYPQSNDWVEHVLYFVKFLDKLWILTNNVFYHKSV